MRRLGALIAIVGCVSARPWALQAHSGVQPNTAGAVRACSILTKDLVEPFTANKRALDLFSAEEEPLAGGGSACEWGVVRLQLYPPRPNAERAAPGKEWQPAAGAGEAAYFRANGREYAELIVWSRSRSFTLQVGVPAGKTPEGIRPDTIALANKIIAKLP